MLWPSLGITGWDFPGGEKALGWDFPGEALGWGVPAAAHEEFGAKRCSPALQSLSREQRMCLSCRAPPGWVMGAGRAGWMVRGRMSLEGGLFLPELCQSHACELS